MVTLRSAPGLQLDIDARILGDFQLNSRALDSREPLAWTVTEYGPGSMSGAMNSPAVVVATFREIPVAVLVIVTEAPPTTAPEESVTVPRMRP